MCKFKFKLKKQQRKKKKKIKNQTLKKEKCIDKGKLRYKNISNRSNVKLTT